jgi:crotonobetainyl-CoA:carnitine CoA-transferase CaiB-like acyl-CoA transferase
MLTLFNLSAKFSATLDQPRWMVIPRGQHQEEILGSLGYTKDDIKAMKDKLAI